jgi:hypothetical protein
VPKDVCWRTESPTYDDSLAIDEQEARKHELYTVRMLARDGSALGEVAGQLSIGDTDAINRGTPRGMPKGRVQEGSGRIVCKKDELNACRPELPGERIERCHGRHLEGTVSRPQRDDRRRATKHLRRHLAVTA